MRRLILLALPVLGFLILLKPATAVLTPVLDFDALIAQSSLIVTGEVVSLQPGPQEEFTQGDARLHGRRILGSIHLETLLKGDTTSGELQFSYILPDEFNGWRSVGLHQFGIFFLKQDIDGHLQFTNPYSPFVDAARGISPSGEDDVSRVLSVLYGTASAPAATDEERVSAIRTLSVSNAPAAATDLNNLLESGIPAAPKVEAAAELLRRNDLSGLDLAVNALLSRPSDVPTGVLQDAIAAITLNVTNAKAVPDLIKLLQSDDVQVRRAAASGLMRIASADALKPLLSVLSDPDFEVRYYAVVTLAEITGQQRQWRPSMEQFRADENKYIQHWKDTFKNVANR